MFLKVTFCFLKRKLFHILYIKNFSGDIDTLREYLIIFPEVVDMRESVHGNVGIHIASSKGNIPLLSLFVSKGIVSASSNNNSK